MAELLFDQTLVPRSTTQGEWREIARGVRVLRNRLKQEGKERLALIPKLQTCRNEHATRMIRDIIADAIYPPIILGPFQESLLTWDGPVRRPEARLP
jgi:hypothetical protein